MWPSDALFVAFRRSLIRKKEIWKQKSLLDSGSEEMKAQSARYLFAIGPTTTNFSSAQSRGPRPAVRSVGCALAPVSGRDQEIISRLNACSALNSNGEIRSLGLQTASRNASLQSVNKCIERLARDIET